SASASCVAVTPTGGPPHSSPAPRPALLSECTQSPASSRSGWATMAGTAWIPTVPVAHWITRYVTVQDRSAGSSPLRRGSALEAPRGRRWHVDGEVGVGHRCAGDQPEGDDPRPVGQREVGGLV